MTAKAKAKAWLREHSASIGSVVGVRTAAPCVVLTYDDGPEPGGTDSILTALAEHNATATFFVLLTRARKHPGLLAEIISAGHEIGLHGIDHRKLTAFSRAQVRRRLVDGREELEQLTSRQIRWFRPPYGKQTVSTWQLTKAAGLSPVMWDSTTSDWRDVADAVRLRSAMHAGTGSILLAHDGFAVAADGANDGPRPNVDRGQLAHDVLAEFGSRGLGGVSLGRALETGQPKLAAWFQR